MQASYTYSVLRGNYPGLFRPENDQLDPNLTSEYDLPTLMTNKNGLLPGDMTHQFKLFAAYNFTITPRFNVTTGASFRVRSGTPVSALGAHPIYGASEAFIIPRGMAGRTDSVTKVDLKGQLEYVIRAPYAVRVSVDLFNVLNSEETVIMDQVYTNDFVQPIVGMDCGNRDAVNQGGDPIANLQADCPGLTYLKTIDGLPATPNTNFGKPAAVLGAFSAPFSARIGVGLTF
jgi:hypothetical protein